MKRLKFESEYLLMIMGFLREMENLELKCDLIWTSLIEVSFLMCRRGNIMRKRIKNYWDGEAYLYCETLPEEKVYEKTIDHLVKTILGQFNSSGNRLDILELGSGTGFLLQGLSKINHNVLGIDISKNMVEISRKRIQRSEGSVKIIQMDAEALLFEDNSFDILIGDNLLWTLESPEKSYAEWYRVLKPCGKIFIIDANWNLWRFDKKLKKEYKEYQNYLIKKYNRGTHKYCNSTEGEKIDQDLYLSDKMRPEWDVCVMKRIGYRNIYTCSDVSALVWDELTLEYNKKTLPFMVCGEK